MERVFYIDRETEVMHKYAWGKLNGNFLKHRLFQEQAKIGRNALREEERISLSK